MTHEVFFSNQGFEIYIRFKGWKKCQCFMETCTRDLAKANTNKAYQEKEERFNMEE
jgi:hypothetical protein